MILVCCFPNRIYSFKLFDLIITIEVKLISLLFKLLFFAPIKKRRVCAPQLHRHGAPVLCGGCREVSRPQNFASAPCNCVLALWHLAGVAHALHSNHLLHHYCGLPFLRGISLFRPTPSHTLSLSLSLSLPLPLPLPLSLSLSLSLVSHTYTHSFTLRASSLHRRTMPCSVLSVAMLCLIQVIESAVPMTTRCEVCKGISKNFYQQVERTDTIEFTGGSKGWTVRTLRNLRGGCALAVAP